MPEPTKIRAQHGPERTVVRIRMAHEQESGLRHDAAGKLVAAWFIQEVTVRLNGRVVLSCDWGPALSKNPYLQFNLKGARPGDRLAVSWRDNRGETRADEAVVS